MQHVYVFILQLMDRYSHQLCLPYFFAFILTFLFSDCWNWLSVTQLCPTLCNPMDYTRQAPLFMEFYRQEYWSGLSFPPPGDLPDRGIEGLDSRSPALQADSLLSKPPLGFFTSQPLYWEAHRLIQQQNMQTFTKHRFSCKTSESLSNTINITWKIWWWNKIVMKKT